MASTAQKAGRTIEDLQYGKGVAGNCIVRRGSGVQCGSGCSADDEVDL